LNLSALNAGNKWVISGQLKDMSSDQGIAAFISTGTNSSEASAGGYYYCISDLGTNEVTFAKMGYQSVSITNVSVAGNRVCHFDLLLPRAGPLNITRNALMPASVGVSYSDRTWVAGGAAPYLFSIASGSLPGGLSLDTHYGFISGRPTAPGNYTLTIGVRDQQSGYSEREFTIEVTAPLTVLTNGLLRATRGQAYLQDLYITGGASPYSPSIAFGFLPAGLNMSSSGRISGIPSTSGSSHFAVRVCDASGRMLTQEVTLYVDEPLSIYSPYLNTAIVGQAYGQSLQVSGGYGPYAWSVYNGALPQGISLDASTGMLSGTPETAATVSLVIMVGDSVGRQAFKSLPLIMTAPLDFVTTTLPNGARNEAYSEQVRVSGGLGPYLFTYTGVLPTGLSLNATNGIISGTPTAAMLNNIQITVQDSSVPTPQTVTSTLALRTTSTLTIISSAVMPSARLNQAISPIVLKAVSGISPYQWALLGGTLPPGIALAGSTGQFTGTPTTAGDYIFTIQVTDSNQPPATATKEFIWHVASALVIGANAVPTGGKGVFYSFTVPVSGGRPPFTWRVKTGSLPAGLTLDAATGTISGIPTGGASVQFALAVTDGDSPAQTAEQTFSISILDKLYITTTGLPNARLGMAYTADVNAALGTLPYTFTLAGGALPSGLTLSGGDRMATVSGRPTQAGQFTFTIRVTDASQPMQTASNQFTISTYSLINITTATLASAIVGQNYSQVIAVTGGLPPYGWSIVSNQLPAGLSLNGATGQITGSPSAAPGLSTEFTVQIADSGIPAAPVQKQLVIYVLNPMITVQPQSQTVRPGVNVTLGVTAIDTPQVSYQWRKNGLNLPGATDSSYSILNVRTNDAGTYSVALSNAFYGSVLSSNAVLTVDGQNPTIAITAPTSGQRWSNVVFTVKGTAKDNLQVSTVWCQVNGGNSYLAQTANGWTNWTASVPLTPRTNVISAYAVDSAGNNSTTNSVNLIYVMTNRLQVAATGKGTLSPNYSNAWLEIGLPYSMTATPAGGFAFTNWTISTNWLRGVKTNAPTVRFMMASNLTLQVNFVDVAKPTLAISSPASGQAMTNALATIRGTASDNWGISGVCYQLNSGAWSQPATTNSWTNWTTMVELTAGTNIIKAYAVDWGGNYSATNTLNLLSSNTFKLQLAFAIAQPLASNGLNFMVQLSPGLNGRIQVSTNLLNWATLTNFLGTNTTLEFRDSAATNSNGRFYRAVTP
jgi:hypothetical protein